MRTSGVPARRCVFKASAFASATTMMIAQPTKIAFLATTMTPIAQALDIAWEARKVSVARRQHLEMRSGCGRPRGI